ncbi:hypothetical protein J5T34_01375 [Cupriavidus gilardii]|uniref:hypothetical protein n=1 Tax=Cupriavidus gilardii TaxID=82541 RepID=UPI001ABDA06C|nr:hypothetical protein [Cupriavidus gilardii]MBO4119385.1 hypothetical protein [Cupriavidus gilardii]
MSEECCHVTCASRIVERTDALPQARHIALANSSLYFGWSGIALCRAGAFVESITAFFRANPSSSPLTTRFSTDGPRHAISQAAMALGTAASIVEIVITTVVFGRHLRARFRIARQLVATRELREIFIERIARQKSAAAISRAMAMTSASRGASAAYPLGRSTLSQPTSTSAPVGPGAMAVLAVGYLHYQTAQMDRREASDTLKHSFVMFARDGVLQGAGVGCNLALLWDGLKISELLHLVAVPIHAMATTICGFAFSLGCGALHIIAGALRWRDGLKKLAAAREALNAIRRAKRIVKEAKERRQAELANAARVAVSLVSHAKRNERRARDDARSQIRLGKWRMTYGAAAMAVGGASLALFLVVGGVSTGGILIGIVGGLALAGWTLHAGYRHRKAAKSVQDAIEKGNSNVAASGDGALRDDQPLALDGAIEQAIQLLDRAGNPDTDSRRLIKHTLMQLGLDRAELWPLRFCLPDPAAKGPLVEELKIKIRNLVDGDGARCAAEKRLVPVPDAERAAIS